MLANFITLPGAYSLQASAFGRTLRPLFARVLVQRARTWRRSTGGAHRRGQPQLPPITPMIDHICARTATRGRL